MVTLSKRALPAQQRMMAIVEGAVRDVAKSHRVSIPARFAGSVAKRAAGTLWSQLDHVLATVKPRSPDRDASRDGGSARASQPQAADPAGSRAAILGNWGDGLAAEQAGRGRPPADPGGGSGHHRNRVRLRILRQAREAIGVRVAVARKAGDVARADALADACRIVGAMREGRNPFEALLDGETGKRFSAPGAKRRPRSGKP